MKKLLALTLFTVTNAFAQNLITNGDFSQTYDPAGGNGMAYQQPMNWDGPNNMTHNTSVFNGVLSFSVAGAHDATGHRYYISQTFNVENAGNYDLKFDYRLIDSYIAAQNGAKITFDSWSNQPTFQSRITGSDTGWVTETINLNFTAGSHTLYVGTILGSFINDRGIISYDNISITPTNVTAVPEPETYALFLAGLIMVGAVKRKRNNA